MDTINHAIHANRTMAPLEAWLAQRKLIKKLLKFQMEATFSARIAKCLSPGHTEESPFSMQSRSLESDEQTLMGFKKSI
jgi:hypothetical protein